MMFSHFFKTRFSFIIFCLLLPFASFVVSSESIETHIWVVRTTGDPLEKKQLEEVGAVNRGELDSLSGFYEIDFERSSMTKAEIEVWFDQAETVLWYEQQKKDQLGAVAEITGSPIEDPMFHYAWHINNSGRSLGKKGEDLNLLPTWDTGFNGQGVMIAVIDEGTELTHPDLEENIRSDLAWDTIAFGSNAHVLDSDESHGTAVSGIIAARDNFLGSVGVAYGSHLVPIRYIGEAHTDAESANVMGYERSLISIYNNSWGPSLGKDADGNPIGIGMMGPGSLGEISVQQGVALGRNGLGSIYVFAAGNDGDINSNVNYNGWANMRETIAVGAIGNKGTYPLYSEPGASVLVSAPSGGQSLGIMTTDRTGLDGYEASDYITSFSGTSASTPMVSGVIALMLDANPTLTWRDVQHILVHSAVQVDAENDEWKENAAGLPFHDRYGFGRVDASSSIQSAIAWKNVKADERISVSSSVNQTLPNNNGYLLSSSVNVSTDLRVEHVYVEAVFDHSNWGDLEIVLVSPSGTESTLATLHDDYTGIYASWTYSSVQFWDETSSGEWQLKVTDRGSSGVGEWRRWKLTVFGTPVDSSANGNPVANEDQYLGVDYPATIPVLANDQDTDGDPLTIISLYQGEWGHVSISDNQDLRYTPGDDFLGLDRFGYTISDGNGLVSDTLVDVIDPRPVPMPDCAVVSKNKSVTIPVLENDFDRFGENIELLSVGSPEKGEMLIVDQTVVFTPEEDFVGYEVLDYTITDNNDGAKSGKIHSFVSADSDFALLFDGSGSYAKIPANQNLNIRNQITIESKFYLRSYGELFDTGFGRIVDRDNFSLFVNGENHATYPDHSLVFAMDLEGKGLITANTGSDVIQPNQWYQIAVTYDSEQVRIFVDGNEIEVETLFGSLGGAITSKPLAELYMGESANGNRAFDGIIDYVRIWNQVRPESELLENQAFIPKDERKGLVSWWQFLEGSGSRVEDSIGKNHGVLMDAKWVPKDPSLLSTVLGL